MTTPRAPVRFSPRIAQLAAAAIALAASGCCDPALRRLDEAHLNDVYRPQRRLQFAPGRTDASALQKIRPGDIFVFSMDQASSGWSSALAGAFSDYAHAAIAVPFGVEKNEFRLLTADSFEGVEIRSLDEYAAGRRFFVFAFPAGTLNPDRLRAFANRAAERGALDYDFSAAFWGLNSNVVPNSLGEIADEYTCATVVAAALHYSGLSLDRACCNFQSISPDDLVHSVARRNLNLNR